MILQGVEFPIFLLIFEWALQQCSATSLPVIVHRYSPLNRVSTVTRDAIFVYCFVQLLVCEEVDIMKTPNIESNLDASTNRESVSSVVPKVGVTDYWTPPTSDAVPAVQVILPVVNGAVPGSYELTEINIIANNFDTVDVTIYDSADDVILAVSFFQQYFLDHIIR